jgi:hypothetical protein
VLCGVRTFLGGFPPRPPGQLIRTNQSIDVRNPRGASGDTESKTPDEGSSTMAEWRLQIYLVSDQTSQELIAGLLAGIDGLVVDVVSSDFDEFVVVESAGEREAYEVSRLVQAIDPGVTLVHTSVPRPMEPTIA